MRLALLLLALAALAPTVGAQTGVLVGTVRDADGTPLPGASVVLTGTARGAAVSAEGRFRIERLAPGAYRVVASMVGYTSAVEPVRVAASDTAHVALTLAATVAALGGAVVEAERDERWARRLRQFLRALVGESGNADSTRLLNPEVLDFTSSWGTLSATAAAPLVFENRALGYRLTYLLTDFEGGASSVRYDGEESFEELAPTSPEEAARWAAARERAYRGSLSHLLRSLLAGTAEAEGFALALVRQDAWGARPSFRASAGWVMAVDADGWGTLRIRDQLEVVYDGEPEEPAYLRSAWFREPRSRPDPVQRSSLFVDRGRARIDPRGVPEDPFAVSVSGHLAFERLADRVPHGYMPTD
ncbi:carboxypeptidase-like regulatory domain-containing protein [Rubrivirga sp. IMCC43871]|uniref:carboxypeptidase-like regulatory domain-containing protein n=1 Tax=Rubrivirga sp. IMCC43871 TaxID=3391575 RepID=UPI0039903964